ncbi:MAG: NADH-quinone oxidoreductase subunit J [Thaumarchaeota archaeon]|nr:NADH-quinone oxidoreductase subunit J [Nitrososphaerota archaeon]MCL5317000.1 NADH-quinone oxidoreductase subunit J [Nitrososphaerota archaeon]
MPELAFVALTVLAVTTAIYALESKEVVYGAVSLAIMLLSMAGFYVLLDSPFVAMFQVIVYVGAVAVLIIFTVMLVREEKWLKVESGMLQKIGLVGGLATGLAFGLLMLDTTLGSVLASGEAASYAKIGVVMITDYGAALEVLALLLAASLIGALMLARVDREE